MVGKPLLVDVVREPDGAVAGDRRPSLGCQRLGALPGLVGLALGQKGARVALLTGRVAVQRGVPHTLRTDPLPAESQTQFLTKII